MMTTVPMIRVSMAATGNSVLVITASALAWVADGVGVSPKVALEVSLMAVGESSSWVEGRPGVSGVWIISQDVVGVAGGVSKRVDGLLVLMDDGDL